MLVTALLDNQSALRYQILNILLEQSQPISLKILMDKVDISKQTLTKYLDEINQMYQEEELEACIST
ncbi:MAG: helix-turn-helix domain-containing protein, partial [Lactobacillus iners]|nr:helix-turn-helix domain-containing protein [Lactobacillus iners]